MDARLEKVNLLCEKGASLIEEVIVKLLVTDCRLLHLIVLFLFHKLS